MTKTAEEKDLVAEEITDEQRFEGLPYSKGKVEQQMGTLLLGLHALGWSPDDEDMKIEVESRRADMMSEPTFSVVFSPSKDNSIRLQYNDHERLWHIAEAKEGSSVMKHPFMGDGDSKFSDMESVLSYLQSALKFVNPEDGKWNKVAKIWEQKTRTTIDHDEFRAETDIETAAKHGVNAITMKAARDEATNLLAEYEKRKGMTEMPKQFDWAKMVRNKVSNIANTITARLQALLPKGKPAHAIKTPSINDASGFGDIAADDFLDDFTGRSNKDLSQSIFELEDDESESLAGRPTSNSIENNKPSEFELADDESESLSGWPTSKSIENNRPSEFELDNVTDENTDLSNPSNTRTTSSSFDDMLDFGQTKKDSNQDEGYWATTPSKGRTIEDPSIFEKRVTDFSAKDLLGDAMYQLSFADYLRTQAGINEHSFSSDHEVDFAAVLDREVQKLYARSYNGVQRLAAFAFRQKESVMKKTKKEVVEKLLKIAGVEIPRARGSKDESDIFFG